MILSEREVYTLAFNRNIGDNLIKNAQIEAAKESWIVAFLGSEFVDVIEASPGDYKSLIEDYIKPIWAFGVLYNNFSHIAINITDKGIIQMFVEGTANVMDDRKLQDAKAEIRMTILMKLRQLDRVCQAEHDDDNALYAKYDGLQIEPVNAYYKGSERANQIKY